MDEMTQRWDDYIPIPTYSFPTVQQINGEFVEVKGPEVQWPEAPDEALIGLTKLYVQAGVEYWGHL